MTENLLMAENLFDQHVLLIGRPPLSEYLGFVTSQTREAEAPDYGSLAREWRLANDRVRDLEKLEPEIADDATVQPVADALAAMAERLLADPAYQRSFTLVPARIGVVELDKLVVFQKHVNLQYVDHLCALLGEHPSEEAIFRFCLGGNHAMPPTVQSRVSQNSFIFVSPSTDFRMLDVKVFAPSELPKYSAAGPVTGLVGLVVGYGSNYFNVLRCEGRLVLNNGSHRAHTLRKLGITHVPCVIQEISRREELEVIAGGDVSEHPDLYFSVPRPPMFRDFFDPRLCKMVDVRRQVRQMKITIGVETVDAPATEFRDTN
jgi:hypothetical protein